MNFTDEQVEAVRRVGGPSLSVVAVRAMMEATAEMVLPDGAVAVRAVLCPGSKQASFFQDWRDWIGPVELLPEWPAPIERPWWNFWGE